MLIGIAAAVWGIAHLNFQSVDDYHALQESFRQEYVVETQGEKEKREIYCTVAVSCEVLARDLSALTNPVLQSYVPADGMILEEVTLKLEEGMSAYDALDIAAKAYNIQLESTRSPLYNSYYVQGIQYLYEKSAGPDSGWIFEVNGKTASTGASGYRVKDGDRIAWRYTLDGGSDVR